MPAGLLGANVAPYAGAWIETRSLHRPGMAAQVAPYAGAWNRTYQDLTDHYDSVVLPIRVVKPRDKAKVEVAVQIVERFVLALRDQTFFSLAELNVAIRECVAAIRFGGGGADQSDPPCSGAS